MDIESTNDLSKLGAEALRDLYNNLAGVKQFALEQAPDVCQQMIQWEITKAAIAATLWVVCTAAWMIMAKIFWRTSEDREGMSIGKAIALPCSVGSILVAIVLAFEVFVPAIKACVAPKVFLLEKIAAMLKGLS